MLTLEFNGAYVIWSGTSGSPKKSLVGAPLDTAFEVAVDGRRTPARSCQG